MADDLSLIRERQEAARQILREMSRPWMSPCDIVIEPNPEDLNAEKMQIYRDQLAGRRKRSECAARLAEIENLAPGFCCDIVILSPKLFWQWFRCFIDRSLYFLAIPEGQLNRFMRVELLPRRDYDGVSFHLIYRSPGEMEGLFKALFTSLRRFPI